MLFLQIAQYACVQKFAPVPVCARVCMALHAHDVAAKRPRSQVSLHLQSSLHFDLGNMQQIRSENVIAPGVCRVVLQGGAEA